MGKTINFLNKVAFAIVTILVLISTATVVRAEDENTNVTEPEKELVLYNADGDIDGDGVEDLWVGFRYENSEGETCLEISYNGKSLESLEKEGYIIEYMCYNESSNGYSWSKWISINHLNIADDIIYLLSFGDGNIYQFRIKDINGNIISISDRLVYPSVINSTF